MIVIDHSKLLDVIAAYKKYFPTHIGDEIYKWKAVRQFQDKWDIDAPDFISVVLYYTFVNEGIMTEKQKEAISKEGMRYINNYYKSLLEDVMKEDFFRRLNN